ncbi:alpha/beta hydrolase [Microbacterium gorillae]|uniref:alpha/beta hydrolase n=1 Tax=Microbacterium gorillae TaxID=1231063 RepID=UPI00058AE76F|nr:alpha/beta hydrolase [Microbacterium gorillae]
MPLHPTIADRLASLPQGEPGPLDPAAMRADEASHVPPLDERHPVAHVADRTVGGVPVRVYADSAEPGGVVVYFHGGAFFLGSLDTHDHIARHLATATGLRVVSVGYRLAPEHAFPAALEDAASVLTAIIDDPTDLGWDGGTLAVVGDSAGGTIATAVAADLHDRGIDRITHQVLYYPALDFDLDLDRYPSLTENAVGYGLETAGMAPFNQFYLDSGADVRDPRVSPIKRADLAGLPAALILTGEFDPMRDEGETYAVRLREAGVRVEQERYVGAGHGFVQHFFWLPEFGRAFAQTADFVRDAR